MDLPFVLSSDDVVCCGHGFFYGPFARRVVLGIVSLRGVLRLHSPAAVVIVTRLVWTAGGGRAGKDSLATRLRFCRFEVGCSGLPHPRGLVVVKFGVAAACLVF